MRSDLFDYIRDYGTEDFSRRPFSELDAMVLTQAAYLHFDGILPGVGTARMSLSQIASHPDAEQLYSDPVYGGTYRELMQLMLESPRFSSLAVGCYVNQIDPDRENQFCGMVFYLPQMLLLNSAAEPSHADLPEDSTDPLRGDAACTDWQMAPSNIFVAFRGTDATLIGWKENFNMACIRQIPSQLEAAAYLEAVGRHTEGSILIGGHSKGGNLAVYSSACANPELQDRIQAIYNLDGPGFLPSFYKNSGYSRIKDKIYKYIPESSLIGLLFSVNGRCMTVKSHYKGIAQHDPLSWVIKDGQLDAHTGIARKAYLRAKKLNQVIRSIPCAERKDFVADTYELVCSLSAADVYELMEHPLRSLQTVRRTMRQWERPRRRTYRRVFRRLQGAI